MILTLAVGPLTAQRPAPAQRGGAPRPETPQLVVSVLSSRDPALGIAAADAIRKRIQDDHSATDLYVVPRPTIERTLALSGYNPDSVLGTSDLWELAKQVRGDYALAGSVERTSSGVRTSIRLVTQAGPQLVEEPLAPIVGSDFGDIAKQVDRAVSEAIRALAFYQDCRKAQLVGDYRQAIAAARQGLQLRPTSAALNFCVLSTLVATHASADSIIAVASAVTSIDSTSVAAWAHLADAYLQKGDSTRALDATRVLYRLEPTNTAVIASLVDVFVAVGRSDSALVVLDGALRAAPTNGDLLRKRWLLQLRMGQYAAALESGVALVAADSTAATVDFYERQLFAAKTLNDSASLRRIAHEASARYPRNVDFLLVVARDTLDHGSPREGLAIVQRVLAIEPANTVAWQLAIAAHARADGSDSAVATARRALAASVPSDAVGASLLTLLPPVLARVAASPKREDWEALLRTSQTIDSVASSARSSFYLGLAAYQVASDEIQLLAEYAKKRSPTRAERQVACSSTKQVNDLVSVVNIAMPKGGSVDPATAGKVLGALPGISDFVGSVKRASCR